MIEKAKDGRRKKVALLGKKRTIYSNKHKDGLSVAIKLFPFHFNTGVLG